MISLSKVTLSLGGPPLLNEVSLDIGQRERICLIGRNGAGKTTLLKLLTGEIACDSGEVYRPPNARVAVLPQDVPVHKEGTVREVVLEGLNQPGPEVPEWEAEVRLERLLEDMQLDGEQLFDDLSAGRKRRVLLAQCVISEPDLLLLDEPTNHLDIESISWLENFLLQFRKSLLFITHDRAFLRKLSTRILDLDRGQLISWDCDYDTYLVRKEEWLDAEARQQAVFDKRMAEEEVWLRQGIKARRTRNEGRKRALMAMREEHRQRRTRTGTVRMQFEEADRSGVKVVAAENVSFGYEDTLLVKDFSNLIERGDKVGLVGPNGVGKTTFLKLLLGQLQPQKGTITLGTGIKVAYFDQLRERLDDNMSVRDAVGDGNETVEINGNRKHIVGYLQDFLFTPDRIRGPIRNLSGGERNRLLLARLFTRPFNVLVMDEPTNDLDLETLDLLEEVLSDFKGTLLLVSHDRAFLNNVTTELLVFEGNGNIVPIVGGYDDYLLHRERSQPKAPSKSGSTSQSGRIAKPRKLLNRERTELEKLPKEIEELEAKQAALAAKLADPILYQQDPKAFTTAQQQLHVLEKTVTEKFTRWEELEQLRIESEG